MPLSKEKMREYMLEYRRNNPEYEKKRIEKSVENIKYRYSTDPEFKERMKNTSYNHYHNKKNAILNPSVVC